MKKIVLVLCGVILGIFLRISATEYANMSCAKRYNKCIRSEGGTWQTCKNELQYTAFEYFISYSPEFWKDVWNKTE